MQMAKTILQQADLFLALMSYRIKLLQAMCASFAQLMLGHKIKMTLPTVDKARPQSAWILQRCAKLMPRKERVTGSPTTSASVSAIPPLGLGESMPVRLADEPGWMTAETVQWPHSTLRSYLIQIDQSTL